MTRHPATENLLRWFDYHHLKDGLPKTVSRSVHDTAHALAAQLPDGAELSAGLRHLLEAKDCFVRAAIDGEADLW